ncbi:uncharacterized protein LOC128724846 [Anopheles nili]|uniref:uncharacterized protein LOC128724846 n=1 Tax=Anopheles nili TaxID=185578 RepID=UPI00237B0F1A|nr:uncharacterized protein LOC128724846 [Anopheles nili]
MADQQPSTSQQQQGVVKQENRNSRKRRLSMNRKKGNKKGARSQDEAAEVPSPLLHPVFHNLSSCAVGEEMATLIRTLQPTNHDVNRALNMVKDDLRRVLVYPQNQATIYEFGSIKSGLLLKDSDLDFYIHYAREKNERDEQIKLIHITCSRMEKDFSFTKMTKILGAKVPLLRAIHVPTNLQCDINFSNARGCYNSKFINAVIKFDERIHHLTLIVKFWAQCAFILTPHKQLNSYCLTMMVIFYLQTRKLPVIPSVEDMQQGIQRINYGPWNLGYPVEIKYKTWNVNSVRELLVGFFRYYSEFDFAKNLISPFVGRLCSLEELEKKTIRELAPYYRAVEREGYPEFNGGPHISIQDPFELNLNIGKVLRMNMLLQQMKLSLKHAYDLCLRFQGKEFSKLLIALFTDVERCAKKPNNPPQPVPSTSTAKPNNTVVNGTAEQPSTSSTTNLAPGGSTKPAATAAANPQKNGIRVMCCLPPIENELYLVKQILQMRNAESKSIITDERVRQLWGKCMMDFIVDILRKLFMVKVEPIETPHDVGVKNEPNGTLDEAEPKPNDHEAPPSTVRTFQLTCERQVFISRKRINISNEEDLKREIEISQNRWEKNHTLQFTTRMELVEENNAIELRLPSDQPKNGLFRLFIDTCFLVHIRKCLRGYFMVMLSKTSEKTRQIKIDEASVSSGRSSSDLGQPQKKPNQSGTPVPAEEKDASVEADVKQDDQLSQAASNGTGPSESTEAGDGATRQGNIPVGSTETGPAIEHNKS